MTIEEKANLLDVLLAALTEHQLSQAELDCADNYDMEDLPFCSTLITD